MWQRLPFVGLPFQDICPELRVGDRSMICKLLCHLGHMNHLRCGTLHFPREQEWISSCTVCGATIETKTRQVPWRDLPLFFCKNPTIAAPVTCCLALDRSHWESGCDNAGMFVFKNSQSSSLRTGWFEAILIRSTRNLPTISMIRLTE